jgi:hypothetical protein
LLSKKTFIEIWDALTNLKKTKNLQISEDIIKMFRNNTIDKKVFNNISDLFSWLESFVKNIARVS